MVCSRAAAKRMPAVAAGGRGGRGGRADLVVAAAADRPRGRAGCRRGAPPPTLFGFLKDWWWCPSTVPTRHCSRANTAAGCALGRQAVGPGGRRLPERGGGERGRLERGGAGGLGGRVRKSKRWSDEHRDDLVSVLLLQSPHDHPSHCNHPTHKQ